MCLLSHHTSDNEERPQRGKHSHHANRKEKIMNNPKFTSPTLSHKDSLCNLTLAKDGVALFDCHSGIVCFGASGSELLHERASMVKSLEGHDNEWIDLSDLTDVTSTSLQAVLEYIYEGEVPTIKVDEQHVIMGHVTSKGQQETNVNQVLNVYNAAIQLKCHMLVSELECNIMEWIRKADQSSMDTLTLNRLASIAEKIFADQRATLSSMMDVYMDFNSKSLALHDVRKMVQALDSHPTKSTKKIVQNARHKKLRRLSALMAKKNVVVTFSVGSSSDEQEEDQERDEKVNQVVGKEEVQEVQEVQQQMQMQRALVVADFISETETCLSVTEGDYVDVIKCDADTGWAGITTKEGKIGYIPVHCIEIMDKATLPSDNNMNLSNKAATAPRSRRRSLKLTPQGDTNAGVEHATVVVRMHTVET